jgi:hypothetical protein
MTDDKSQNQEKDTWISVYKGYQQGKRYEAPFKDPEIILWIKKSFSHRYSPDALVFKYELYSTSLFFIDPRAGNFTCVKMTDYFRSAGCGVYSYICCEILDESDDSRQFCWLRNGPEDLAIFGIIRFLKSLRCFTDWQDYEKFESLYRLAGVTWEEIESQLGQELSGLGINREGY